MPHFRCRQVREQPCEAGSFLHVGSRGGTQVVSLGKRSRYLFLDSPRGLFFFFFLNTVDTQIKKETKNKTKRKPPISLSIQLPFLLYEVKMVLCLGENNVHPLILELKLLHKLSFPVCSSVPFLTSVAGSMTVYSPLGAICSAILVG